MLKNIIEQNFSSITQVLIGDEKKSMDEIVSCVDHLPHAANPIAELRSMFKQSVANPILVTNLAKEGSINGIVDCVFLCTTKKDMCVAYESNKHIYVHTFPLDSHDHRIRHMGRRDTIKYLYNKLIDKYTAMEPTT